jgi:hypothetical protein
MNTNTMLNNSGSSFDTVPSYDFILRREDRDEEEEFEEDDEEPEVFHLIDGVPEVGAGVLIVPPTSDSEGSRNTVLSVPDTVPSVLSNSILPVPNSVHVVEGTEERESSDAADEPLISAATDQSRNKEVVAANSSFPRRILIALLVFVVVAAFSISEALRLRHETWLLKEQVRLLQEEAALSAATLAALQEDQAKDVLLDNCWLQANAKMTLGECAQGATDTVRTHVLTIQEYAEQAWGQMKQAYSDSIKEHVETIERVVHTAPTSIAEYVRVEYKSWKDWIQEELSSLSKDLPKGPPHSQSTDTPEDVNAAPESYADNKSSSLQAVSKSVLMTAVWSTAAALLVSTLDFYWKQQSIKG